MIVSLSVLSTIALSVGITYAASYKAPTETTTYEFGSMSASNHNFQDLAYYFDSGAGTVGSPFIIKNSSQLRNLSKLQNSGALPDATYVSLGSSFQYEGTSMEPIGNQKYPFTGVFNGCNYLISGLKVSSSLKFDNVSYVGMFGVVGNTAATGTVHSLLLAGPEITYTGNATTVKIGIVAGKKNTDTKTSVVENIQVYGGTSDFSQMRACVTTTVTTTGGDGIVGIGGSSTSGFVNVLESTPTYTNGPKYESGFATGEDYTLWYNGSSVVDS